MKNRTKKKLHKIGIMASYIAIMVFLVTIIAIVATALSGAVPNIAKGLGQRWVTIVMSISTVLWFLGSITVLLTEKEN